MYIKNSFRTFEFRFCDETGISDWVNDYKEVIGKTNKSIRKYSHELLSYIAKDGNEEVKLRRLRVIDSEMAMLKMKLNKLEKEK